MPLYVNYPTWLKPEVIPGFVVRWYGVMYLVAFTIAIVLFRRQAKHGELGEKISDDDILSFFWWAILGLILGARIFSTLVYDQSGLYWHKPWLIFWPFNSRMQWIGFQGMSFHGGFIGCLLGCFLWCLRHKKSIFVWGDALSATIPLGYTFGRLGNFINGELYGRITTDSVGMIFPHAEKFSTSVPWVQNVMAELNMTEVGKLVNLPRHPSQLYEALFEGIILWLILWFVVRKHKPFEGFTFSIFTIGYGFFRFFIEYFREPDADIGYRIGKQNAAIYLYESPLNISTGQILCFLMVAGGLVFMLTMWAVDRKKKRGTRD